MIACITNHPLARRIRPKVNPCLDAIDGGPREANHGLVCASDYLRIVDALDNLVDLVTHLRSLELGGGQTDEVGVRTAKLGFWPLAPGPVAADVLFDSLVRACAAAVQDWSDAPAWDLAQAREPFSFASTATIEDVGEQTADLVDDLQDMREDLVKRQRGALAAIELSRQFQAWSARYPLQESEHRVPLIRCRSCQRQRLSWNPPRFFEDEVRVQCEWCGAIESQRMVEFDLRLLADERKQRRMVLEPVAPSEG